MAPGHDADAQMQIIHSFSRICFPHWNIRVRTRILRPERPEYSMIMGTQDDNATARRQTVFRILNNSLVGQNDHRGYPYPSLLPLAQNRCIITAVTAILFDQECSSTGSRPSDILLTTDPAPLSSLIAPPLSVLSLSGQSGARMVASLIEHMLLIDYGIAERPLRSLDPEPTWMTNYMTRVVCHGFCKRLIAFVNDCRDGREIQYPRLAWMDELIQSYWDESSADNDFSDVGLMLYFFWTRRRDITKEQYNRGLTGYNGVLGEMVSEITIVGTDRLTRKLSVDVNKLIPRYIKDEWARAMMISIAQRMARDYGLSLRAPEYAFQSLTRPSTPTAGSSGRGVISGQRSIRNNRTVTFERNPTPPPSYSEATGLP